MYWKKNTATKRFLYAFLCLGTVLSSIVSPSYSAGAKTSEVTVMDTPSSGGQLYSSDDSVNVMIPFSVVVGAPTSITDHEMTLTGIIHAPDGSTVSYYWRYGPFRSTVGKRVQAENPVVVVPPGVGVPVRLVVHDADLKSNTRYWSQLFAKVTKPAETPWIHDPQSPGTRAGQRGVSEWTLPTPDAQPVRRFYTGFTHGPNFALNPYNGQGYQGYAYLWNEYWAQVNKLHYPGLGVYRIDVYYDDVNGDNKAWRATTQSWPGHKEYDEALKNQLKVVITLRQGHLDVWPSAPDFAASAANMADFAHAAIDQFPDASYFEVGNETNGPWHGSADTKSIRGITGTDYAVVVRAVLRKLLKCEKVGKETKCQTVKPVLVGSINGDNVDSDPARRRGIKAGPFIEDLFNTKKCDRYGCGLNALEKGWIHALSLHPYPLNRDCGKPGSKDGANRPLEKLTPAIEELKQFLAKVGTTSHGKCTGLWCGAIWLTEFDWNRTKAWDADKNCTADIVAKRIGQLFNYLGQLDQVKGLIWYGFSDTKDDKWLGGLVPPPLYKDVPYYAGYNMCKGSACPGRTQEKHGNPTSANNPYLAWLSHVCKKVSGSSKKCADVKPK